MNRAQVLFFLLSVFALYKSQSLGYFVGRSLAGSATSGVVTNSEPSLDDLMFGPISGGGPTVGGIVGGFTPNDLGTCFQPMVKVYNYQLIYFFGFHLTKCETQVVAGINYRLTIVKASNAIPSCQLQIFLTLDGYYYLTGTGDSSTDCLLKLQALRGKR